MAKQGNKAVFLDRDGVINAVVWRNGGLSVPYSILEFVILPRVEEAIQLLKNSGFLCVVVTNQPEIGRKNFTYDSLETIHNYMKKTLPIDAVYVCTHSNDNECECKKPKPGMVYSAAKDLGIDITASFIIGDRWRDVELARAVNCRSVLIPSEATHKDDKQINADFIASDFWEAANIITSIMTGITRA